jgi:hypothetical protein
MSGVELGLAWLLSRRSTVVQQVGEMKLLFPRVASEGNYPSTPPDDPIIAHHHQNMKSLAYFRSMTGPCTRIGYSLLNLGTSSIISLVFGSAPAAPQPSWLSKSITTL